jgi:hypothetical protein
MSAADLRRHALRWAPVAACAVILVWHSLQYDFVTDDAYISFVYSRNLAEHGQLTFNLGQPVEGYTNFLWTFLLGILMLVGIDPAWSSRVLGTLCGIGTLVVAFRLTERLLGTPRPQAWREISGWPVIAPLLLAWSSGFACWCSGGLETQLFTLLVALAIEAYVVSEDGEPLRLQRAGLYLALAAMTRPEGLLVAGVIAAHRVGLNLGYRRRVLPDVAEWRAIGAFLILWAPWFAWRWWYYGWPFPNTYYVKATGTLQLAPNDPGVWAYGGHYLAAWVHQVHLVWIAPVLALGLIARPRTARFAFATLAVLLAAAYLYYTASVGGDFMGLHRFIMPIFVLVAVLAALGFARAAAWLAERRVPWAAPAGVAAIAVLAFAWSQWRLTNESLRWDNLFSDNGIDTPAYLNLYTKDRAAIGRAMASCFEPDDFSVVGGAGAQPYFGRMQAIDIYGLVSDRIAHEDRRVKARPGHDKWGTDEDVLSYDPTFLFYCYDLTAGQKAAQPGCGEMIAKGYERVSMHIPGLHDLRDPRLPAEYYTFLVKKSRHFECPGLVR